MEKKVTKKDVLNAVKALALNGVDFETVSAEDVIAYVDTTIAQMDAKNEKAKARAAEKRAEGDALMEVIYSVLTDKGQTAAEIMAQIEGEDLTQAKVSARLTKLVNAGKASKEQVKVDNRKLMAYTKVATDEVDA